jgi:hypothetical protein
MCALKRPTLRGIVLWSNTNGVSGYTQSVGVLSATAVIRRTVEL